MTKAKKHYVVSIIAGGQCVLSVYFFYRIFSTLSYDFRSLALVLLSIHFFTTGINTLRMKNYARIMMIGNSIALSLISIGGIIWLHNSLSLRLFLWGSFFCFSILSIFSLTRSNIKVQFNN